MTASALPTRWTYTPDGATTVFQYTNVIYATAELAVFFVKDGVISEQLSGFTVSGVGNAAGGNVTFSTAPTTTNADTIVIERTLVRSQTLDLENRTDLPSADVETALNKAAGWSMDMARLATRALRQAAGSADADIGALPEASARALRVLAFDASGDPVAGGLAVSLTDVDAAVAEAEASATAAAASETAAAASATAAAADAADVSALVQNIPNMATGTGDGTTTTLTLPAEPVDEKALLVSLDGIFQHTDAFSVSGTTLTFDAAPPSGVAIEVRDLSSTAIVNATDVSTLAAIAAAISTVAGVAADVSTVAANDSDISDVADDLNGANTIGAAITAASNAASSATAAAGSATAAAASATAAATAETNAETAETAAETAQAAAETAQTAAEAAQAAAETAQTAAETAETNAETAETNAASSASAAASSASSAASAVADAIIAAARAGFRNRFGVGVPFVAGFALGETSHLALTRATVGFTNTDGGGVESKAIDALRLTFDPDTGEPLGLLAEPAQTNHHTKAHQLTGIGGATYTANNAVAPDGTTTAATLYETATSGQHFGGSTSTVVTNIVNGSKYSGSAFVKDVGGTLPALYLYGFSGPFNAAGSDYFGIAWDFATETIEPYKSGSSTVEVGFERLADGWYRLWWTQQATGTSGSSGLLLSLTDGFRGAVSYAGSTSVGVAIWGQQVELVSGSDVPPSSIIVTAGSEVTRSADLATIDLSAVSAFRPDGFSLIAEVVIGDDDGVILSVGTGSTNEIALDLQAGVLHLTGADSLDITAASGLSPGDALMIALRVYPDDVAISVNGAAVVTDSSHALNADADELQIGANIDASDGCPVTVQQIALAGRLADAVLEAISNG